MKRQVPRGVPGILPLVGHGNYVRVVEMSPIVIAAIVACLRRRRSGWIALQPLTLHVVIKLLRPQQAREALTHHVPGIIREVVWDDSRVGLVGLQLAGKEDAVELAVE